MTLNMIMVANWWQNGGGMVEEWWRNKNFKLALYCPLISFLFILFSPTLLT